MGRILKLDEQCVHEGWAIGYAPADWRAVPQVTDLESRKPSAVLPSYGIEEPLRELGAVEDEDRCIIKGVRVAGYGCACGWRARPVLLAEPLEWMPRILLWTQAIDDELAVEWSQHVEQRLAKPITRSPTPTSSRSCRECGRALEPSATSAASARLTELLELLELRKQQPGEAERAHRLASAERYESAIIHARVVLAHVVDDLADICVFCSRRAREL